MELPRAQGWPGPAEPPGPAAESDRRWDETVQRARACWERFRRAPLTRGALVRVHACNKYLIMAHSPVHYRALGRIVAAPVPARIGSIDEQVARYPAGFEEALAHAPSIGTHVNVLQHLAGYFKHRLSARERANIAAAIAAFRAGQAPLSRPLALIARHARALRIDYLLAQTYLDAGRDAGPGAG